MTMMRPQNKVNVKLDAIAKNLVQYQPSISGSTDITVMGISMNSKTVQAGDLYAAVAGAHHHGADYLDQALLAGAVAVLTDDRGVERILLDVPANVVEDFRATHSEAATIIYYN